MFNQIKSKEKELIKIREDLHEKVGARGTMLSTSHQDPQWSEAKAYNLGRDVEALQEKENKVIGEINEIKSSEGFKAQIVELEASLDLKTKKLQDELAKTQDHLTELKYDLGDHILNSGDPIKLVVEIKATKDHIDIIMRALEAIGQSYNTLVHLSENVYQPYHAQDIPKNQKFDVPTEEQLRAQQKQ